MDSRSYLRYVRGMYSDRIFIPSDRDVADAFKQYQEDARQRHSDGKLSPGERFEDVASVDQLTHQVSIWAINGLLTRLMFDRNTDREFYVEESFPLEWMYPRLTPNGLIMKINRQPLSELDAEIVRRDREFWIGYLAPIVGAWLNHQSNLAEIVEFIERVYLRDELRGFNGDPHYVHNEIPQQSFSKLRSTFGGLYAWRAGNCRSGDEKEFLLKEAEFAFRQALVLCPKSPEVVFRYVNLLLGQKRESDAIRIVEPAVKLANVHQSEAGTMVRPTQLETLLRQLNKMNRN